MSQSDAKRKEAADAITKARATALEAKLLLDESFLASLKAGKPAMADVETSRMLAAIDLMLEQAEARMRW